MHLEAADSARELFDEQEIILPGKLFSSEEIIGMRQQAYDFEARLRDVLSGERDPWLRSLDSFVVRPISYGFFRIWQLMYKLGSQVDLASAGFYPSFSRIHISFVASHEQSVMEQALASIALRQSAHARNIVGGIKRGCVLFSGWAVNKFAGICLKRLASRPDLSGEKADILVAGLLSTDLHAQRTLVRLLRSKHQGTVAWYCYSSGVHDLSQDEKMRQGDETVMTPVNWRKTVEWRYAGMEQWSRAYLNSQMVNIIEKAQLPKFDYLPPDATSLLARYIIDSHEPLRKTYAAVKSYFDPLDPSVVVGNCNCNAMAFAREWARENNVPYVKLPHGFEYDVEDAYEWDNEATGFLGGWLMDSVAEAFPDNQGLFCAGGAHFAEQSDICRDVLPQLPSSRVVCLLASDTVMTDYPDHDDQQYAETIELAGLVSRCGLVLSIRCHPRSRKKWLYQKIVADAARAGIKIELSDSKASLSKELHGIAAAVMRLSSGSAIVALYQAVPLIGWTPRPGLGGSDKFLSGLPYHGISASEIAELAHKAISDPNARMDVLSRQRDYLAQIVEDPYGDPWQRSIDVILREYEKAKREERL